MMGNKEILKTDKYSNILLAITGGGLMIAVAVLTESYLLIGVVLFLLFGYFLLRSDRFRLFMLIFSMPLTVVSYYMVFTLKMWMCVWFLSMFLWMSKMLLEKRKLKIDTMTLLLLVLFVINIMSVANAINVVRAVKILIQYVMLFLLAFYTSQAMNSEHKIKFAVKCIMISGTLIGVYGILQWIGSLHGYDIKLPIERLNIYSQDMLSGMRPWHVYIGNRLVPRIRAAFPDPNIFGGYILSFLPIIVSLLLFRIAKRMKITFYVFAGIVGVIAVLGAVSRTALGGAAIGLLTVLYYWRRKLLTRHVIVIVLLVSIALPLLRISLPGNAGSIMDLSLYIGRIGQTFRAGDGSTTIHMKLASDAINMWEEHPLLGVGIGNYGAYLDPQGKGNGSSHSALMSFFAETGVLGGVANLAIVMVLIFWLVRNTRHIEKYSYWFALNVGLLGSYVSTVSANITYIYYNEAFVWFLMGLIAAVVKWERDQKIILCDEMQIAKGV
jgi:hypothetical protein